jgi:hypothetical protein
MTTEKVKRTYKSRLTHAMAYRLGEWLKANPEILRTTTKRDLAKKAGDELGFSIDDWSLSVFAKNLEIEIGFPKKPRAPKKKLPNKLTPQDEIVIVRKWIEVLLRKSFKNPTEATMAWREIYGHFGPDYVAPK